MDTEQLIAFDRVAKELSFSRAAFDLGIGQPAISARIQALEAAVGGKLFARGRRIALTPLGEGFLPYARRVLETLDEGIEASRRADAGQRGRVRLGVLGSLAGSLAGPAVAELVRTRPEVECILRSGDHEVLVEMLLDGVVEMAIVTWPAPESFAADLAPLLLLREAVVLAAHSSHALARRRTVSVAELVRLARPLLHLRWWPHHHPELTRLAHASGRHVEIPKETARDLVRRGVGAGFFPRTYLAEDLTRGDLREIRVTGLPPLSRDVALVRRSRAFPLSPQARHLVELLAREARKLGLARRQALNTSVGP